MQSLRAGDPAQVGGYRLLARLGAGSMGRVFLGHGPSGDLVAVKIVHARFAHRQDRRERFAREIAAAQGIDSAYVAPVVGHDADAAEPWLATAYLPGLTLREAVAVHGPLPARSVRALGAALARALAAIHDAGVVHRDLKPSNLILTPDGPRLVDFGIARPDGAETITAPGSVLGTPGYIPPERIRERRSGRAGDVFALGALLVYAATGEGPFGSASTQVLLYRTQFEDPRLDALRTALDGEPELVGVLAGCLARDPRRRPTAGELVRRMTGAPGAAGTGWLPDEVAADVTHAGEAPPARLGGAKGAVGRRAVLSLGAAVTLLAALGPPARGTPPVRAGRSVSADGRSPLWTYRSPDGEHRHWFNRPTVAGNAAYLSSTRGVHALDCSRGDLLWTANHGIPVYADVVPVSGEVVVFSDGFLRAVQIADGSPALGWHEPRVSVTGSPAVAGGQVYLCDSTGRLAAYDGRTGRRRWSMRLVGPDSDGGADRFRIEGNLDPVVAGGRLYVAPGGLFAVDPATRDVHWRFEEATTAPVVRDGLVYAAGADHVHALDGTSGEVRWSRDVGGRVSGGVTIADGLVVAGDDSGRVHALDARTGRPRWRFDTGGPLPTPPAAAAGTVYAGSDHDRLYAIGTAEGRLRWSHPLGRQTKVHAQVWRDRVLVCVDLTLLCAFPL
ncbi:protein kinase domain-containing protein [Actinomadura algeriensis]|uniref:Outer membrane protein assembly factor BamB n=1 Tax=Actinomadura algeriensis TaxID=1679523 RepID=A0ABR9JQS4_9ACTN|nr:PQQ-binding-like beta-propeller repeat protein [Actinomadura algeriensis]MBE1532877.1 outer membrane protein assembly factor BamB [Actinomadura algeriensis]